MDFTGILSTVNEIQDCKPVFIGTTHGLFTHGPLSSLALPYIKYLHKLAYTVKLDVFKEDFARFFLNTKIMLLHAFLEHYHINFKSKQNHTHFAGV